MDKLVVIGSGMAGGKLIEELMLIDHSVLDITIIGDEPYGNYDRIRLTELIKEDELFDFWLNTEEWYKENNIKSILGEKVIKIDSKNKTVITDKNKNIKYDKLVIATGAIPFIPKIDGVKNDGIFTLRNIEDTKKIKNYLRDKNDVLVIGGGLLGLELAYALNKMGKNVTVSHLMDSLIELQLNKEASKYLEKEFLELGINLIMNTSVDKINSNNNRITTDFKNGKNIYTDMIIINCGIIPNIELAKSANLDIKKGIIVNNRLETSEKDIYSIGECIEYNGQTYGLIAPIFEQARTLAKILAGEEAVYNNSLLPASKLKSDFAAIAIGKINEESHDTVIKYENPISKIFKKIIIDSENKLAGAHLVGEDLNSDALGIYYTAKLPLPKRVEQLIFPGVHKEGESSLAVYWPNDIILCDCNGISSGRVREAIREYKDDLDVIVKVTRAGTSCGSCKNRVQSIIDNTYDAIFVGAGLGGLTAAATLAKNGKRVLIIEKHDQVGGYASSFGREGFEFEVSLHNFGPIYGTMDTIFKDLELDKKLEYIPFGNFQRIIFPKHNIDIPKGIDGFAEKLIDEFPDEKEGIKIFFDEIKFIRQGFDEFELLSLSGDPKDMIAPMMAVKYPQFVDLVYVTFEELLNKYLKNNELKGLAANLWWYFGLPPSKLASILYSVPSAVYFEHGGGYIKGSSQKLSDTLAEIVIANHGKVILDTEIKKILIQDKIVGGVLTDQGEIFYSDIIVSNAGGVNTFLNLSDEDQIKKRYIRKVSNQEISLSAIQLYLGIDCDPKELGFNEHSFTVFNSYDHEKNYKYVINGEYDKTFFSCTNYTKIDPSSTPQGKGIINIFSLDHIKNWENLTENQYQIKKNEVTDIIIKKVEKYIPDLNKHIIVKELGTPKTMFRYTFNPEGSIYGPSQLIEQSGVNRLQPFTPVKGLFIVGSSIYPGGGYSSVFSSGYKTAKMILFAEKNKDKENHNID